MICTYKKVPFWWAGGGGCLFAKVVPHHHLFNKSLWYLTSPGGTVTTCTQLLKRYSGSFESLGTPTVSYNPNIAKFMALSMVPVFVFFKGSLCITLCRKGTHFNLIEIMVAKQTPGTQFILILSFLQATRKGRPVILIPFATRVPLGEGRQVALLLSPEEHTEFWPGHLTLSSWLPRKVGWEWPSQSHPLSFPGWVRNWKPGMYASSH